ncbi:MAG TPA: AAA family ATPase [Clostridiales bacterium]|nr:AAA family ATPase [Clostridiales bacterium]
MLLRRLKLNYFGRFHNKELELKPGINLIYGENESGKSTLHTFIKGMLFGIEPMRGRGAATKDDVYHKYLPWEYPQGYSGSLELEHGNKAYQLQRSFHAKDKSFSILDLATGREIKLVEGTVLDLVPGLTEATFKNTISIEQLKASTDAELAAQVQNYIANLSLAKSQEVDVVKALQLLSEQRKLYDGSQTAEAIKKVQAAIKNGLETEEQLDRLTFQLKELQIREQQLAKKKSTLSGAVADTQEEQRMGQLPAILEKYRSYQRAEEQLKQLENQHQGLSDRLGQLEGEAGLEELKDAARRLEQLKHRLLELKPAGLLLQQEKEKLHKRRRAIIAIDFSVVIILVMAVFLILGAQPLGFLLMAVLVGLGAVPYTVLHRSMERKGLDLRQREYEQVRQIALAEEGIKALLLKYQISRPEELSGIQEKAMMKHMSIENLNQHKKELEQRVQELEDQNDLLYEAVMKYIQYFLEEDELNDGSIQRLQEEIGRRRQEAFGKGEEIDKELNECRLLIEKLRWEITSLEANEEELLRNKELYEELLQKQEEDSMELEAVKLAHRTIQELAADIHDSFGQQLNMAASQIIREVTKDKYRDLKIDERLNVKVGWNGSYVQFDRLSAGTMDQVYLALRLAVADLLLGEDQAPLILDDSLALYDDSRVKAALEGLARRKQIILFTCHKREEALLQELGLTYHLVDLSK